VRDRHRCGRVGWQHRLREVHRPSHVAVLRNSRRWSSTSAAQFSSASTSRRRDAAGISLGMIGTRGFSTRTCSELRHDFPRASCAIIRRCSACRNLGASRSSEENCAAMVADNVASSWERQRDSVGEIPGDGAAANAPAPRGDPARQTSRPWLAQILSGDRGVSTSTSPDILNHSRARKSRTLLVDLDSRRTNHARVASSGGIYLSGSCRASAAHSEREH